MPRIPCNSVMFVFTFTLLYIGCWCSCCRQLVWRTSRCRRTRGDGSTSRRRAGEPPLRTSSFTTATFLRVIKLPATHFSMLWNYRSKSNCYKSDCPCCCWILKRLGRLNLVNNRWERTRYSTQLCNHNVKPRMSLLFSLPHHQSIVHHHLLQVCLQIFT